MLNGLEARLPIRKLFNNPSVTLWGWETEMERIWTSKELQNIFDGVIILGKNLLALSYSIVSKCVA